jgi:hypothetical protein
MVLTATALMALMMAVGAFAASAQDYGQVNDSNQSPQGGPFGDNQSQGPGCGHQWCDWYQACTWQYWGWDPGTGWVLLTTDGSC